MNKKRHLPPYTFPLLALIVIATFGIGFAVFARISNRSAGFTDINMTEKLQKGSPDTSTDIRYEYSASLEEYEKYFNPIGKKRDIFLLLNETPDSLIHPDSSLCSDGVLLSEYAARALEALLLEMEAEQVNLLNISTGLTLTVTSGYRDADGYRDGLTCDIHNCTVTDISFKSTDAYEWLEDNAWKFGFIIRFPEGKISLTGTQFKPWMFRFVGRYHAEKIYRGNLCLEEYIKDLQ